MRKIGLIQVDGKFPNIAVMRIASYHRAVGDDVEWWVGNLFSFSYDMIYASTIFKFSDKAGIPETAIIGGTGISPENKLPEAMESHPYKDGWFLYPHCNYHIGFTQRGCRLSCSFCVVPKKEGKVKPVSNFDDLLSNPNGGDRVMLLDNDFFGNPAWEEVADEIIMRKLKVCFSQGLNIRIITDKQIEYLAKIDFRNTSFKKKQVTFAWDNYKDKERILNGVSRCIEAGIKPYKMQFFILVGYNSTREEDMERIETIRQLGADPFVMAYNRNDPYQRRLQRWVNHKAIFKSVSFGEYK